MLERLGEGGVREGSEHPHPHHAGLDALGAQLVHDHARGACRGAYDHDGDLGVFEAVGVEDPVLAAAELGVLVGHVLYHLEGPVHGPVLRDLVLEVPAVQAVERPHGDRVLDVQQGVYGLEGPDEVLHLLVGQHDQGPDGPADHVAVVHVRDGQAHVHVLGDADRHDAVVVGLLVVLAVELYPAGVAAAHGVAVVAVDVDGPREGAVHRGHDDGQAVAGGYEEHLPHEGVALGGGGGHGARARGRRADDGAHGRVLRLHRDELRGHLAVGHYLRVQLHDLGLRGDGVGAHHVGVYLAHRLGDGLVTGDG